MWSVVCGKQTCTEIDHQYYTQVQMQMGLLGMSMCDFVVDTKQGLHVTEVSFDSDFYSHLMTDLNWFAKHYLFLHLLAQAEV